MDSISSPPVVRDKWSQMGSAEKKAIIDEEVRRMSQLPPNSSYAMHRLRVLKKIQELMSIQVLKHYNFINGILKQLIIFSTLFKDFKIL